jgi:hypothetical protein
MPPVVVVSASLTPILRGRNDKTRHEPCILRSDAFISGGVLSFQRHFPISIRVFEAVPFPSRATWVSPHGHYAQPCASRSYPFLLRSSFHPIPGIWSEQFWASVFMFRFLIRKRDELDQDRTDEACTASNLAFRTLLFFRSEQSHTSARRP